MNAQEIINELATGKTVAILADDAFEFMREVEQHNISCEGIAMIFARGQCVMAMETRYYCPEHQYNPPAHSRFAPCPQCEIKVGNWGREAI